MWYIACKGNKKTTQTNKLKLFFCIGCHFVAIYAYFVTFYNNSAAQSALPFALAKIWLNKLLILEKWPDYT